MYNKLCYTFCISFTFPRFPDFKCQNNDDQREENSQTSHYLRFVIPSGFSMIEMVDYDHIFHSGVFRHG